MADDSLGAETWSAGEPMTVLSHGSAERPVPDDHRQRRMTMTATQTEASVGNLETKKKEMKKQRKKDV